MEKLLARFAAQFPFKEKIESLVPVLFVRLMNV